MFIIIVLTTSNHRLLRIGCWLAFDIKKIMEVGKSEWFLQHAPARIFSASLTLTALRSRTLSHWLGCLLCGPDRGSHICVCLSGTGRSDTHFSRNYTNFQGPNYVPAPVWRLLSLAHITFCAQYLSKALDYCSTTFKGSFWRHWTGGSHPQRVQVDRFHSRYRQRPPYWLEKMGICEKILICVERQCFIHSKFHHGDWVVLQVLMVQKVHNGFCRNPRRVLCLLYHSLHLWWFALEQTLWWQSPQLKRGESAMDI